MRVAYIGNVGPGTAEHSTENDIARAFIQLGHVVTTITESRFCDALQTPTQYESLRLTLRECDLVLYTMTQGVLPHPDRALDLWDWCTVAGVPTAAVHLDIFYGLSSPKDTGPQRSELPAVHPMFRMDYVFTADGDHDAEYRRDGVEHYWLPPAVRHDQARDIGSTYNDVRAWGGYDVAFVGSYGYHPEWSHRPEMVDALRSRYGEKFLHVGNGSEHNTIRGEPLNRLYATVPVIVGDSCFADASKRYWSDRFPETYGRGGFLVFNYVEALSETISYPSFEPYDWHEMIDTIDYCLARPAYRESFRQAIATEVRMNHTYVNRVRTIIETVGL